MRKSRTVKKGGIIKFDGWRWQSDDLLEYVGHWVWIVVGEESENTIRIEEKDGTHLADAERRERIV